MSAILQVLANTIPSGAVPVPDLTGASLILSAYGLAAGWQNGSPIITTDVTDYPSTASIPYPLDWTAVGAETPPVALETWYDQSGGDFSASSPFVTAPVINTDTQRFTYDGTQNLAMPSGIISGDKLTIYIVFSTNNLAAAQTLLQLAYPQNYITDDNNLFAIYLTAVGVITVSQKTNDTVDSFNTKIKTLSDTGLHLLTVVFDRSVSGAGATVAKLDNLTTGWTSAVSDNMTGTFYDGGAATIGIGLGQPLGSDAFLDGSCESVVIFTTAHDSTAQDNWYNYFKYIYPDLS